MERRNLLRKFTSIHRFLYKTVTQNNIRYVYKAATKTSDANEYQLEDSHIEEAKKLNPLLAAFGVDLWKRAHQTFVNHGLPTINFLRIATGNPAILRYTPERIINSMEQWRGCQFGEKNLHLFITKYPEMLDVDNTQKLHKHITFLKSQLLTQKNVWQTLMNSPDIMEQAEQTIEEKMEYLTEVMRLEIPEIVKSSALSRSLQEIRTRHVFQERLGLFKPRNPKTSELQRNTNDRLYKITDTSEKTFATKVCHVTLDEYEAFKELFKREYHKRKGCKTREYAEDDYEDDSEDDETYSK